MNRSPETPATALEGLCAVLGVALPVYVAIRLVSGTDPLVTAGLSRQVAVCLSGLYWFVTGLGDR